MENIVVNLAIVHHFGKVFHPNIVNVLIYNRTLTIFHFTIHGLSDFAKVLPCQYFKLYDTDVNHKR